MVYRDLGRQKEEPQPRQSFKKYLVLRWKKDVGGISEEMKVKAMERRNAFRLANPATVTLQ